MLPIIAPPSAGPPSPPSGEVSGLWRSNNNSNKNGGGNSASVRRKCRRFFYLCGSSSRAPPRSTVVAGVTFLFLLILTINVVRVEKQLHRFIVGGRGTTAANLDERREADDVREEDTAPPTAANNIAVVKKWNTNMSVVDDGELPMHHHENGLRIGGKSGGGVRTEGAGRRSKDFTVFLCGWPVGSVAKCIFSDVGDVEGSDVKMKPLTQETRQEVTKHDILVTGMYGPCPVPKTEWKQLPFAKELHINGERYDDVKLTSHTNNPSRVYRLGPYVDGRPNTMKLYHLVREVYTSFPNVTDIVERLTLPNRRPKSTGERFMLYVNRNCVPYREKAIGQFTSLGKPIYVGGSCKGREWVNKSNIVQTTITTRRDAGAVQRDRGVIDEVTKYRYHVCMENGKDTPFFFGGRHTDISRQP